MGIALYSTHRRADGRWTIRGAVSGTPTTVVADLGDAPSLADAEAALAGVFAPSPAAQLADAPAVRDAAAAPAASAPAAEAAETGPEPVVSEPEAAPPVDLDELNRTALAVVAWISDVDVSALPALLDAERAGRARKTVITAIESRLARAEA